MMIWVIGAVMGILTIVFRNPLSRAYEWLYREKFNDDRSARSMTPGYVLGTGVLVSGFALLQLLLAALR